jgi:uncharacterized protein
MTATATRRRVVVRRALYSLALIAVAYIAVVGTARHYAPRFVFPIPTPPAFVVPSTGRIVVFETRDGIGVRALRFPGTEGRATIVHFHGNRRTIEAYIREAEDLSRRGFGVVLVEYRGYGIATDAGVPSEDVLYADAAAVLDGLAKEGRRESDVVLWGTSLGTGVAAEMALRGRAKALVLVTPFTSLPELAARMTSLLPMGLVLRDRFDNLAKAKSIHIPAMVVHGDEDEIVPIEMGRAIADALSGARFVRVNGGHHNDLFDREGSRLLDLIAELAR